MLIRKCPVQNQKLISAGHFHLIEIKNTADCSNKFFITIYADLKKYISVQKENGDTRYFKVKRFYFLYYTPSAILKYGK